MGKLQSKHECFFVNPGLNEALKDELWKSSSSDLNLDTFTMEDALSELSLRLEEKSESSPLRVELPPPKVDTDTAKLFNLDELSLDAKDKKAKKSNITIEDFRYGVQLETSENSKQEWFFTLYNFDGHGRITKEDLASLLKALYDAVGSSIQLPPNGAKTLKLRLSVGQDHTAHLKNVTNLKSAADLSRNTATDSKLMKSKVKDFSKLNNLMQAQSKVSNTEESNASRLANQEAGVSKSANQDAGLTRLTNQEASEGLAQVSASPECLSSVKQQDSKSRIQLKQLRRHKDNRKESSNNQQHKRRYRHSGAYCPVLAAASALAMAEAAGKARAEACIKKGDNLVATKEEGDKPAAQESQDRRNYYLDLAGVENTACSRLQNDLTGNSGKGGNLVMTATAGNTTTTTTAASASHNHQHHHHHHHHQPRSRSHDTTKCDNLRSTAAEANEDIWTPLPSWPLGASGKCDNVQRENERLKFKHGKGRHSQRQQHTQHPQPPHQRSKSFDCHENARPPKSHQQRQSQSARRAGQLSSSNNANRHSTGRQVTLEEVEVVQGVQGGPSPHRRHRHRGKDHELAMQQVAQWIKREHAWAEADLVVHRHHHIHEHHHHHHYHHYYET